MEEAVKDLSSLLVRRFIILLILPSVLYFLVLYFVILQGRSIVS